MQIANETVYQSLSSFESLEQLNEAVRKYKDQISEMNLRQDVKRNLLLVLEYIKRHSCRFFGVSWKGKRKIASELGLSDRTVIRLCQRLESLGFIQQHEMKRASDMQQTSNAIVIAPAACTENVRQATEEMSDHKNNISLKQKHNINHLNVNRSPYIKFVPKSLQHYQSFFGKQVKDLYGRVWLAAKKLGIKAEQDIMQEVGFKAMEQVKQYIKDGKQLSGEEKCKLAYAISYKQLEQRFGKGGEYLDWNYEAERLFKLIRN
ncbi:helix-turn-helix domain-containing protein [Niallia taxi]|uniref:Uncharacterized protein n=1 Tax=Niallia taxi TaxID=2499688 RepID=A0A3S2W0H4_9BACI|nr:helix-turn-helix domain-containing protein [Niallia taxi]RVT56440.1 hypothetical protein EM808_27515 [Niallia taxi]